MLLASDTGEITGMRYNNTTRLLLGGKQAAWSKIWSLRSVSNGHMTSRCYFVQFNVFTV